MINFREINSEDLKFKESFTSFLSKRNLFSDEVSGTVRDIISQIRTNGDEALKFFTKEFDNYDAEEFVVSEKEINHDELISDFVGFEKIIEKYL